MKNRRHSFRASLSFRIFVSLIGVAAISSLLAGGMSFYLSLRVLRNDVQLAISNSAQKLVAAASEFDRQMEIENWMRLDRDFLPTLVGEIIRVSDENNNEIFVSFRTEQIDGLTQQMLRAQVNELHFGTTGDTEYAIWTTSYQLRSGSKRLLQVALPLPSSESFFRKSAGYFILVFVVILSFVALISFALRRRILRPVASVASHLAAFESLPIRNWSLIPHKEQSEFFGDIVDHVNELINRMQESVVFRENWARSIAHEIRTPLMLMLGELETTDVKTASREDLQNLFEQMKVDVLSIESIVKAVLEIGNRSSLDQATPPPVPLKKELDDLTSNFQSTFGLKVNLDYHDIEPSDYFQFDWSLLRIVLDNLLRNSLKHGKKKNQVKIVIRFQSGNLQVVFEDQGLGYSEVVMNSLKTWTRWDSRLGVGLNLCKQIEHLTGWQMDFANRPEGGTRVVIFLPSHKLESA